MPPIDFSTWKKRRTRSWITSCDVENTVFLDAQNRVVYIARLFQSIKSGDGDS